MGLDQTDDSAKARELDSADFQANLSAQMWSPEQKNSLGPSGSDSSAASFQLANLTISSDSNAVTKDTKEAGDLAKTKAENAAPKGLEEANSYLFKAANSAVHESIYKLPKWASLPKPSPDLGCVSSFSNRYREALKDAGVISSVDDKSFRNLYQVNMDELNKSMGVFSKKPEEQLMRKIEAGDVKEGDVIEGINPGTSKRHMGIVGGIENGQRIVYDNYGGVWRKEGLNDRFGQYKEHNYYRVYLPPKK